MNIDMSYLEERAATEIESAQRAEHPAVSKAHYLLAGLYLNRIYGTADPLEENTLESGDTYGSILDAAFNVS